MSDEQTQDARADEGRQMETEPETETKTERERHTVRMNNQETES